MQEEVKTESFCEKDCAMEELLTAPVVPWSAPGFPWTHLKRRFLNEDPFFEDGNLFYSVNVKELSAGVYEELKTNVVVDAFSCHFSGCNKGFDSVANYECHYNSKHRNVCRTCKRVFPTNHLLEIHVLEWHDSMFQLLAKQKNMYQCLLESCSVMFSDSTKRKKHMIELHKYPSNYRFDRPGKSSRQKLPSLKVSAAGSEMEVTTTCGGKKVTASASEMEVTKDCSGMEVMAACGGMEVNGGEQNKTHEPSTSRRQFSYKVPRAICFGQGAVRSFKSEKKRGKKKHWHQTPGMDCDTSVNIEKVNMMDLATAIDS